MSANKVANPTHVENLKLENNKTIAILDAATKGGYGIIAVCCYNFEEIFATRCAAEAMNSPAMVLLFPWALQRFDGLLVRMAADVCRTAKVPMSIHLDHCQDADLVKYAASLPFDSIMVDMSHYEKEENLRLTKELTTYCHERGIATEAEPGRIEGGEDGVKDTAELESIMTSPAEALEFLETGIDFLAPAFGNVHGEYGEKGPRAFLQFERLRAIQKVTAGRASLVLHGSGEFTQPIYQECVKAGISKINVNVQLVKPWSDMMQARTTFTPLTTLIEDSIKIFQEQVMELMQMVGSVGKAEAEQNCYSAARTPYL